MTKRTKLFTEKVWKDWKPARKIVGWENVLMWTELPEEYQDPWKGIYPYYYTYNGKEDDHIFMRDNDIHFYEIYKGTIVSEKEFKTIVKLMKLSGERLHKILENEKKAKWSGMETVEI